MPRPTLSNDLKRPVRVSGRISVALKAKLERAAIDEGRPESSVIERALKQYLSGGKKP